MFKYIHCESKKLDPFSFEHNFGKYCPILINLSLFQTEIICPQTCNRISHFTYSLSPMPTSSSNTAEQDKNQGIYKSNQTNFQSISRTHFNKIPAVFTQRWPQAHADPAPNGLCLALLTFSWQLLGGSLIPEITVIPFTQGTQLA